MKKKWLLLLIPPVFVLFIFVGGEVVQHLYNWLAPALFGWREITFWQALGLLALCRILFGGFGFHSSSRGTMGRRMALRWMQMTPEEREKLRQSWRSRCGDFETPGAGPAQG